MDSTSAAEQVAPKRHHEQTKAFQKKFIKDVKSLEQVINAMCNPFADYGKVLFRLHTIEVLPEAAVLCTERLQEAGLEQYESYVNERLVTHTKSVFKPIKKNRLDVMAPTTTRQIKTPQEKALQDTCSSLAQLYVASEVRGGSSDEFFSHENQIYPSSLSEKGSLWSNTKSDLVTLREKTANITPVLQSPNVKVLFMDGAVIAHYLPLDKVNTFADYVRGTFFPHIRRALDHHLRVGVVFDVYKEDSLKEGTRKTRGKCVRIKVFLNTPLPKSWPLFLNDADNKSELFSFLAEDSKSLTVPPNKQLIVSSGDSVVCVPEREDTSSLSPCNHEEADSRLMVHHADAVSEGYEKFMIRTVDSDVVVVGVAAVPKLNPSELWVSYGTGKDHR